MSTGFDLGVQVHGLIHDKWIYQVGIFNGTGIDVNLATKTNCDDHKWLPSLLYAGRLAFMPKGEMPTSQGSPENLNDDKMSIAVSASYNAEAEFLTSSDTRVGVEFAWIKNRWYVAAEGYYMNMHFTKIMQKPDKNFWGAYAQLGYFITPKLQGALRYDFYDRNATDEGGLLNMPAAGLNYYFFNNNLKLQVMYQYLGRSGHATQNDRDEDAIGLARHSATAISLCAFGEDKSKPLQTQRISKPAEDGKRLKLRLNNVTPDTRSIEVAVISRGLRLVYSYYTSPVDDSDEPLDLSVGELDLASFKRIQAQVFDLNCLSCHGGGSGLAGQLDLRDDVAYKSLVNVKAPLSEEGKNYVTPGNINNSFLLDILENNPVHKDMFNSSGKQEVLALIQGWILGGALDN